MQNPQRMDVHDNRAKKIRAEVKAFTDEKIQPTATSTLAKFLFPLVVSIPLAVAMVLVIANPGSLWIKICIVLLLLISLVCYLVQSASQ